MPLLGAHLSIAGGLHNALLDAQAHHCQTVQAALVGFLRGSLRRKEPVQGELPRQFVPPYLRSRPIISLMLSGTLPVFSSQR